MSSDYIFPKKSDFKRLSISDIKIDLPDLKESQEPKAIAIANWLIGFIKSALAKNEIQVNDVLPSKAEFAYTLGVSIGTMQNAIRRVEDLGYVESKQCIGTLVRDYKKSASTLRKLTSKRDLAIEALKRYIKTDNFKIGEMLPSVKTVSIIIGYPLNTTRVALDYLSAYKILEHKYKNASESGWAVKNLDFELQTSAPKNTTTLVDMVVVDLENYINNNLKVGDRVPSNMVLAKQLKASMKTVYDAVNILVQRGILLSKRGRYGTSVIKMPNSKNVTLKPETSIFAPAKDAVFYYYEKTQNHIKKEIANNYQVGDKLPSVLEWSRMLDVSPNTIRKAIHNLADEGYLVFSRGRYGGTFVIDIPEIESAAFKWIAVNPQYAKEYSETN